MNNNNNDNDDDDDDYGDFYFCETLERIRFSYATCPPIAFYYHLLLPGFFERTEVPLKMPPSSEPGLAPFLLF